MRLWVWIGAEGGSLHMTDLTTCDVLERDNNDGARMDADRKPGSDRWGAHSIAYVDPSRGGP